jgi:hypothetical protein
MDKTGIAVAIAKDFLNIVTLGDLSLSSLCNCRFLGLFVIKGVDGCNVFGGFRRDNRLICIYVCSLLIEVCREERLTPGRNP